MLVWTQQLTPTLSEKDKEIGQPIINEILSRLTFLNNVGLLKLNSFSFRKAVDAYQDTNKYSSQWGHTFAVGGEETQSSKTNAVVLIASQEQNRGSYTVSAYGSANYMNHPFSQTSFVINNSQGADIIQKVFVVP